MSGVFGPHAGARLVVRGNEKNPRSALILLHGRGTSAEHICSILDTVALPEWLVVFAPQATDQVWFPNRFYEPKQHNEPHLTSALSLIETLVDDAVRRYGIASTGITIAGFSQGASLTAEYLSERPAQFNGACIFAGGLMGSDEELAARVASPMLLQTPIYIGCDPEDPHVPHHRLTATRDVLMQYGGNITYREYADLRHAIHPEGIRFLSENIRRIP
jgi:predicted esterase